jgi:hypothetical protein
MLLSEQGNANGERSWRIVSCAQAGCELGTSHHIRDPGDPHATRGRTDFRLTTADDAVQPSLASLGTGLARRTFSQISKKAIKTPMSHKRPGGGGGSGFSTAALSQKIARLDDRTSASAQQSAQQKNRYLSTPVQPEKAIHLFLTQVRNTARGYVPKETLRQSSGVVTAPFCEVEVRLGILKVPHAVPDRRVTSGGAKHVNKSVVQAFDCSRVEPSPAMDSGVSRSHFLKWTGSGISEVGPVAAALGVAAGGNAGHEALKRGDVVETEMVETVYTGYSGDRRVAFEGYHDHLASSSGSTAVGKMEYKEKVRAPRDMCHIRALWTEPLNSSRILMFVHAAASDGSDGSGGILRLAGPAGERKGRGQERPGAPHGVDPEAGEAKEVVRQAGQEHRVAD